MPIIKKPGTSGPGLHEQVRDKPTRDAPWSKSKSRKTNWADLSWLVAQESSKIKEPQMLFCGSPGKCSTEIEFTSGEPRYTKKSQKT
ncbi:hypothetical protein [Leptothermofonsia sp. ETS-13]|uniref:hypothetical protein n=1 Tax=Leptothermofonsia sp. ETS-13 TaxID=3035696 RepID=UPI003BA049D8